METNNLLTMKFLAYLIPIFIGFPQFLIAQNQQKVDSLINVLNNSTEDSTKLKIFEKLYSAEIYHHPKKAKDYVTKALEYSKKLGYKKSEIQATYAIGNYYYIVKNIDSSRYFYRKALNLGKRYNNEKMIAKSLSSMALIESIDGNFDLAIKLRDTSNLIFKKINDYLNYGIGVGAIGQLYTNKGNYTIAYTKTLNALRILDTVKSEPYRKADLNIQIGNIETSRNRYREAIHYFNKGLDIFIATKDNVYQSNAYLEIGHAYFNLKEYDAALEYSLKGLAIAKKYRLNGNKAAGYSNIGKIFLHKNQYDDAIENLNKSLSINEKYNIKAGIVNNKIHLGRSFAAKNNYTKALSYLEDAYQIATKAKAKESLKDIYRARASTYEKAGLLKKAIASSKKYVILKDSLNNITNSKQIEELKIIYETEKKEAALALQEKEIENLNKEVEISNLRKGLYAGGMLSFVAISGLLFFGFRQRIKKNKIEREKQEEIYKQEIEFKKKELTSQTLHLVQKNSFLQELKDNLESLKNSPDKFKTEFRRIVMLLKKESASDKDWEVFKSYFTEVHDNFDNKLRNVYPEISEKEIRLSSFLKMNLSTKEIADIFNVLPDSVLKSKYRLKKKLQLDKETDLYDYLIKL